MKTIIFIFIFIFCFKINAINRKPGIAETDPITIKKKKAKPTNILPASEYLKNHKKYKGKKFSVVILGKYIPVDSFKFRNSGGCEFIYFIGNSNGIHGWYSFASENIKACNLVSNLVGSNLYPSTLEIKPIGSQKIISKSGETIRLPEFEITKIIKIGE